MRTVVKIEVERRDIDALESAVHDLKDARISVLETATDPGFVKELVSDIQSIARVWNAIRYACEEADREPAPQLEEV